MKVLILIVIAAAAMMQACAGESDAKILKPEDYDAPKNEVCPIHDAKLQKDVVPLAYGDVRFEPEYLEAVRTRFPHANDGFHNAHNAKNFKFAEVLFCAECRRAKEKWLQNRKTPAP